MTLTQILQKIRSAFYTKAETDATYLKDIAYNTYSRNLILTKGDGTSSEFRVVYSNQAEYAQKDWNGNNITDTYSTKTELTNGLNSKANDANVVHKSGDETINGAKTFTSEIVNTSPHFRHIYGDYGTFWRQDGTNLYLLLTNSGDPHGGWNNFRPLTVNLATGICDISGTAGSATYASWLRTSSHSDHIFHTDWDGSSYFWTYVTAGDGSYRAVRVERANSAGYADNCGYSRLLGTYADDGTHFLCPDRYDGWNTRLYMTYGDKSVKADSVHVHHADYAARSAGDGAFFISGYQIYVG